MKKLLLLFFCLVLVFTVIGCGGGSGGGKKEGPAASIILNTASVKVLTNGNYQFGATALDKDGNTVHPTYSWSIANPVAGSIGSTGKFQAGSTKDVSTIVTCQVVGVADVKATANVTVNGLTTGTADDTGKQLTNDVLDLEMNSNTLTNNEVTAITTNINDQLLPGMDQMGAALEDTFAGLSDIDFVGLFQGTPGTFPSKIATKSFTSSATPTLNYGTWTTTYTDADSNEWTESITRSHSGANDTITFTVSSPTAGHANYTGTMVYPTALLTSAPAAGRTKLTLNLTLKNDNIRQSTFSGLIDVILTDGLILDGIHLNGVLNLQFLEGNYFKYTGDINWQHDPAQTDQLSGILETADIKLSGAIQVNYAANSNEEQGYYPSKLVLDGSIQSKASDPMILEGKMTVEAKNAATVNTSLPYSSSNFLHGFISFEGLIQANSGNKIKQTLSFEETAYQRYRIIEKAELTSGGVLRDVTLTISNSTSTNLRIDVHSSWGPAFLRIDSTYSNLGIKEGSEPLTVTGGLYVNKDTATGTPDATISYSSGIITINYSDGTSETL